MHYLEQSKIRVALDQCCPIHVKERIFEQGNIKHSHQLSLELDDE